jgi:hypothetical protein
LRSDLLLFGRGCVRFEDAAKEFISCAVEERIDESLGDLVTRPVVVVVMVVTFGSGRDQPEGQGVRPVDVSIQDDLNVGSTVVPCDVVTEAARALILDGWTVLLILRRRQDGRIPFHGLKSTVLAIWSQS